jgi:hypothetical protein
MRLHGASTANAGERAGQDLDGQPVIRFDSNREHPRYDLRPERSFRGPHRVLLVVGALVILERDEVGGE